MVVIRGLELRLRKKFTAVISINLSIRLEK